jgi:hypothetical protein
MDFEILWGIFEIIQFIPLDISTWTSSKKRAKLLSLVFKSDLNSVLIKVKGKKKYRTRAIITRGLYIFYPILVGQKRFFKELFRKFLFDCEQYDIEFWIF